MPRPKNRRKARKTLQANRAAEERYARTLADIVRAAGERLRHAALGTRSDAGASSHARDVESVFAKLVKPLSRAVSDAWHDMFLSLSKANAAGLSSLGIPVRRDVGLSAIMERSMSDSVSLIKDTVGTLKAETLAIIGDPENVGLRVEDLADLIRERTGVSESRAELIARDQTLKTNGNLTANRQRNAGITSYVWSTSLDDRVRPDHAALEGKTIAWDDPPDVGHPGEDIQCRCVAIPVIDEFAGLDD